MISFKVENGDLAIENGTLFQIKGKDALTQRLVHAIRLDKGSWYFAPNKGIPWVALMGSKAASERLVRSCVEKILKEDSEVISVQSIEVGFDRKSREISTTFSVDTIYGEVEGEA